MKKKINRREVLGAAGAALLGPVCAVAAGDAQVEVSQVSAHTFRLTVGGAPADDGALVQAKWGAPVAKLRGNFAARTVKAGGVSIGLTSNPLTLSIVTAKGEPVQQIKVDGETGAVLFATGSAPLLGLGEGGPQFDRRGSVDRMRSGQGGYQLRTFGGRVPIQWLVGTGGWAMFLHAPYGTFDFTGAESKFLPRVEGRGAAAGSLLRDVEGARHHHGGVRAHHGACRAAAAVELRVSAVASHASEPRGRAGRG